MTKKEKLIQQRAKVKILLERIASLPHGCGYTFACQEGARNVDAKIIVTGHGLSDETTISIDSPTFEEEINKVDIALLLDRDVLEVIGTVLAHSTYE